MNPCRWDCGPTVGAVRKRRNLILLLLILGLGFLAWLPKQERMTVFLTGDSYWDNRPPGSAIIGCPVIREFAGGTGTTV